MNTYDDASYSLRRGGLYVGVLTLVLALLTACAQAQIQTQEPVLLVPAGEQTDNHIATITRDVIVEGEVQGDVTSWMGNIHIAGHVSGDVVNYGGGVMLTESALVDGNVLALVGNVQQVPGAQIVGQRIETDVGRQAITSIIHVSDQPPLVAAAWPGYALLNVALVLLAGALAMGSITLWPHRTERITRTYLAVRWRSTAIGLLTTLMLGLALLPLSALLAVTLIGMPLIVLLIILLHLPYLYGLVVIARALLAIVTRGRVLQPGQSPSLAVVPLIVVLLLLPCMGIGIVSPLAGLVMFYVLSSGGFGAAILSRGGVLAPLSLA